MARVMDFKLPDLGEGLTEGEILQWMVAVGDVVTLNQPIVEVETAKAAVEVPSPYAGVVTALHHPAGSVVDVGAVIISVDTDPGAGPVPGAGAEDLVPAPVSQVPEPPSVSAREPGQAEGALIGEVGPTGRTATLVGYGPKSVTATRRARTSDVALPPPAASVAASVAADPPPATAARVSAAAVGQAAAQSAGAVAVLAKPPVRKLARELGVDLAALVGTGPGGTVSRADVEAAAGPVAAEPAASSYGVEVGRERRIPVKGVRKMTAEAMVASAFSAPHVTEFLTFDITPTMELVQRLRGLPELAGVKVTPLLLVAKALLLAVRRNPDINASFEGDEIVVRDYVHLGIAAATPRGLLVPNLKDADRMSLVELARGLQELTETARAGKTSPADMAHGTITITNVGVFGVDTGTPILNPGEAAILCFGAVRPTPWVVDGEVVVRQVTTLALSFDHRCVDGQLGSQFLADVARVLADPSVALLWS